MIVPGGAYTVPTPSRAPPQVAIPGIPPNWPIGRRKRLFELIDRDFGAMWTIVGLAALVCSGSLLLNGQAIAAGVYLCLCVLCWNRADLIWIKNNDTRKNT